MFSLSLLFSFVRTKRFVPKSGTVFSHSKPKSPNFETVIGSEAAEKFVVVPGLALLG